MCLITPNKESRILEEDLIVYKVLHKDKRSLFQDFTYKLNTLYSTNIKEESADYGWSPCDDIDGDFLDKNYPNWRESPPELICIAEGFHSSKTPERITNLLTIYDDLKIFKCLIPKGSEIFEDETNLIVSDQIIIEKYFIFTKTNK